MIRELAAEFPQTNKVQLCRILGISRSQVYRKEPAGKDALLSAIEKIVVTFLGYGYRRVQRELKAQGCTVGERKVRRLLRENGLNVKGPKCKGITKRDPQADRHENLLRQYSPTQVDEIWATDMTLLKTQTGACYLAVMEDLFSRKVVAWHLSRSPDLNLAIACLEKALTTRKPAAGWIHHSDQGSVYTAPAYVAKVRAAGGRVSMSRVGKPTDNAYVESFFRTLKKEEVQGNRYDSFLEVEASIHDYIEGTYNGKRMHSGIGFLSPDQFEARTREVGQ